MVNEVQPRETELTAQGINPTLNKEVSLYMADGKSGEVPRQEKSGNTNPQPVISEQGVINPQDMLEGLTPIERADAMGVFGLIRELSSNTHEERKSATERMAEEAGLTEEAGEVKIADIKEKLPAKGSTNFENRMGAPGVPTPADYRAQRDSIIASLPSLPIADPRLDAIRTQIVNAHDVSGPEGISPKDFEGYGNSYAEVFKDALHLPPADEIVRFSEALRKIALLDGLMRGDDHPEKEFWRKYEHLTKQMEEALANYDPTAGVLEIERSELVNNFVGSVNPFGTGIQDQTLRLIIGDKEALERFIFRIVGTPLQSETGDYSLGFYGQINVDAATNLLQTLSENPTIEPDADIRKQRGVQLDDANTIKEGIRFVHELNRLIVGNDLEGSNRYASGLQPNYQQRLSRVKGVGAVQRLLDAAHAEVLSRDRWINADNYQEMMNVKRNKKTGKLEENQDRSVFQTFKRMVDRVHGRYKGSGLVVNDQMELEGMEEWEVKMAYNIGRNLYNISHRGAEWISQGDYPGGNRQYESFPQEGFARIMNFGREMLIRFKIGENRGGLKWFDLVMESMQRSRRRENYGQMQLDKIKGDEIRHFELPTLTGVRGWWASWRAVGGIMRQIDSKYEPWAGSTVDGYTVVNSGATITTDTKMGLLIDTDDARFVFRDASGNEIPWGKAPDKMKADYFRSVFLDPSHPDQLRPDIQVGLGTMLRIGLGPSGGKKHEESNSVKEQIRALLWERTAAENPLAIVPYLHGLKFSDSHTDGAARGRTVNIYDTSGVNWQEFSRKLAFFNEVRLSKIRGLIEPDGTPTQAPVLNYTLRDAIRDIVAITGGADSEIDLTIAEAELLERIAREGSIAAGDLANVKFAFVPFLNDVIMEKVDYDQPGAEAMRRHYNDLAQFNSSNSASIEAMNNLGLIKTYENMIEFWKKFESGITGVHGDLTGKKLLYPIVEGTVKFFRRGEDAEFSKVAKFTKTERIRKWFKNQDEYDWVLSKFHKPNSIAQHYYNYKVLSLDRGQAVEAMDEAVAAGLIGSDEKKEFKKRITSFWRAVFEGIFRGSKAAALIGGVELFKKSFDPKGTLEN